MQGLLGLICFILVGILLSEKRREINWRLVSGALVLQFIFGILFLKLPFFSDLLLKLNQVVVAVDKAATAGSSFMFGYLGGGPLPFEMTPGGSAFIIAFKILPIVLLVNAISAVLFHWGILQKIINLFSLVLQKTLKISGIQAFMVSLSLFFGIIEAPLFVKPYLSSMSRQSLFVLMTAGMATVAGTVIVLYASVLTPIMPGAISHILTASIMSAPAALMYAHLLMPGAGQDDMKIEEIKSDAQSTLDALVRGTMEGIEIILGICAMIIVLIGLVSLFDQTLIAMGLEAFTLEKIFGYVLRPFVWLIGIPSADVEVAANLMSTKIVLNEFVAYQKLAQLGPGSLSDNSKIVLTYAMCGFINLGSLGIMVGCLGKLIPERRQEVLKLSVKSMLTGLMATATTAAVYGLLASFL